MKRIITIIATFLLAGPAVAQNFEEDLSKIHHRDQNVRLKVAKFHQEGQIDSLMYYAEQMMKIDAENQQYVAKMIRNNGIPDNLSSKAYSTIFLVVDRADLAYQKRYFKPLKRAAKQGKIKASEINTLYDRILMHRNRRQLFGTQTVSKSTIIEGEAAPQLINYVWPVKRTKTLDARRENAGMGTMRQQAEAHEKYGGYKMIWDKSLSVKKLKAIMEHK